jgi:Glycosyl transferases group 1
MRIVFVYWDLDDSGSAQTLYHFGQAARRLGHEVVLYADENPASRFICTKEIRTEDVVVFLLEWNIYIHKHKPFDLEEPVSKSHRGQRVILDDDGMYNDQIKVGGDYNHPALEDSRIRSELYDSLSDTILQPTYHPLRPNVRSFLFHGYSPTWEQPLDWRDKPYGMVYVGSNWFRWRALHRVLRSIEPVRPRVGRIGLVGHGWDTMPWWIEQPLREDAYFTDPDYLRRLEVELEPAVQVQEVVPWMSRGVFCPVLVRPTFNHLRIVNPRMFETPAANTIPLFGLDREHVREIYGEEALPLVMAKDQEELSSQIQDVLCRPERYAELVIGIRRRLAERHSFEARVCELIEVVRG